MGGRSNPNQKNPNIWFKTSNPMKLQRKVKLAISGKVQTEIQISLYSWNRNPPEWGGTSTYI